MKGVAAMKRRNMLTIMLLAVMVLPTLPVLAQGEPACSPDSGTVITLEIESEALGGREKPYTLYLPPNWCHLEDLPVLVMLHGMTGDNTDWVDDGHIDAVADELILAGEIKPLIILMPDADNSFYMPGPGGDYETYIVEELVSAVDAAFPTAATRETRFVGGLSMGGFGALYLGLRHPDVFSAIGAHSPALYTPNEVIGGAPAWMFGVRGELYAERDPVTILVRGGWPEGLRLYTDIGISDPLLSDTGYLLAGLANTSGQIDFEGHLWPGAHDWNYWGAHVPDYLRFYAGIETAEEE